MSDVTHSLSGPEAADATGITYRQLHHWIAQGYITPSGVAPRANWSAFTPVDVARITTLGRTGRIGWSPFLVAPVLAEIAIGGGDGYIVISRADTDETTYRATWVRDDELRDLLADDPGPHVITPTALPVTKARTKRRTA